MKNIFEIKTGIPPKLLNVKPLIEQYKINARQSKQSGKRIFPDGSIYITVKVNTSDVTDMKWFYKWIYFTHLKDWAIHKMQELIEKEFNLINPDDMPEPTSHNTLTWKSFLNGKSNNVRVGSGMYSNLPPVFQKIDNLVNIGMYKMDEHVKEKTNL